MSDENQSAVLDAGAYEVIRGRLAQRAQELQTKLGGLNSARQEVFGTIPIQLAATERISTKNNCIPRDIDSIGANRFLFGFNVFIGLKTEIHLSDVFAAYEFDHGAFREIPMEFLEDPKFVGDFKDLYKFYKDTVFSKFHKIGPTFYMVFQVGKNVTDVKTFKWQLHEDKISYVGNRNEHEFQFPPQHEFTWVRTHRDLHRKGKFPHISIDDRVFVETVGGDLTIKIEDNTESGLGIYSEPVSHSDQTLDDAEIFYSVVDHLILLKIRPYQEREFRYLVFNEKVEEVRRIDTIRDACVLLPEGQGIIFPNGYYLQLGGFKEFPSDLKDLEFERRLPAPNGEDHLFVFYQQVSGTYVLMPYNIIEQTVETPMVCHGFSLFENGEIALFRANEEATKHHVVQVWRTPFIGSNVQQKVTSDSYLAKVGNASIVQCMAECRELLTLLGKEDTFAGLYGDIVKRCDEINDSYFWIAEKDAFALKETLVEIRKTAAGAIDEFEKVAAFRKQAKAALEEAGIRVRAVLDTAKNSRFSAVGDFVDLLTKLRSLRGDLAGLKELRFMDVSAVSLLEGEIAASSEKVSQECVKFLLSENALDPFRARIKDHEQAVVSMSGVARGKELEAGALQTGRDLELLVEIVGNLKIEDAAQTTRIVEAISGIFTPLNQIKAAIKTKLRELRSVESAAEFTAQTNLLDQNVLSFLDLCDTVERCDELSIRVMMHVEELEAKFSEFDEYITILAEKRNEIVSAFDARKRALNEARTRKIDGLMRAAERILQGMRSRVGQIDTLPEIHSYFAADMMVSRVRDIIAQLQELNDPLKAGDLESKVKVIREDAVRQLKDRSELFVGGNNVIQFGNHRFAVNHQPLELTITQKDEHLCAHLIGTNLYLPLAVEQFEEYREFWNQESASENRDIYRGEFLSYLFVSRLKALGKICDMEWQKAEAATSEQLLAAIQEFMRDRYAERYVKGIHDHDAAQISKELIRLQKGLGLLGFDPFTRSFAVWFYECNKAALSVFETKTRSLATIREAFGNSLADYSGELASRLLEFTRACPYFAQANAAQASIYLCNEFTEGSSGFVTSSAAASLLERFRVELSVRGFADRLAASLQGVQGDPDALIEIATEWLKAFGQHNDAKVDAGILAEAAVAFLRNSSPVVNASEPATIVKIDGLKGDHPKIKEGALVLNFHEFQARLDLFVRVKAAAFEKYAELKRQTTIKLRADLKIDEFKTEVLSSFVRNKLLDEVFLPLVGSNLAKQIGVVGNNTRTDRMGLLLLVSPPGYGKTTLMEYVANRLGITFVKVNGPAIGNAVHSLDPAECKSASAREEVEKLNLAFEMGDNVMIYLDDIQHCNPELLQKFISLCDGQRKIEGVFNGIARTYNLRGKKVAVVMAGNPYTESGDRFQIPDMLANRADTYNLGDMTRGHEAAFKLSYIENAMTSNPVLAQLGNRSRNDIYAMVRIAETESREGIEFESQISAEQAEEFISILKKLCRIRDVLLAVNQMYIQSAAQADQYRTEPPFKLQGSYRNMNKISEKVLALMNDEEVESLIESHYQNEAQTLTTGAEANLLKWRELLGKLSVEQKARWEEIKKEFRRSKLFGSGDQDPVGRVVAQMSTFKDGLDAIREALEAARLQEQSRPVFRVNNPQSPAGIEETAISAETLAKIWDLVAEEKRQREDNG